MNGLFHLEEERHQRLRHTANYLAATETHTYATAIAAYALLSFFPFVLLLLTLTRSVLRSPRLYNGLLVLLRSYLPVSDVGVEHNQTFIMSNLQAVADRHGAQAISLVILLLTCTGIFLPMEVALNRIWNAPRNRSYLSNWRTAILLAFSCGVLGMLSASLTALTETYSVRLARFLARWPMFHGQPLPLDAASVAIVRAGALPFTVAVFFLIYWRLPNVRVPARAVLPAALVAGLLWEASKYVYILLLPWLNFRDVYGPFAISVSLLLWAYVSALILLMCSDIAAPIAARTTAQAAFDFDPPRSQAVPAQAPSPAAARAGTAAAGQPPAGGRSPQEETGNGP